MENKPLWTITRVLEWTKQYFANKGIENPRLDAEILLCAVLKCERITLYVHFDQPLDDTELAEYRSYVTRRANQEPLAYILGTKAFMKHSFKVTPAVLVPRPETELLVESVAKAAVGAGAENLLDIGTGSGAIIVSLLDLLPQSRGTAVDISAAALVVAGENAENIGVSERLTLVESDLFSKLDCNKKFDIIVSNPPIFRLRLLQVWQPMCRRNPLERWMGGLTDLIFIEESFPDVKYGFSRTGCWLLKLASIRRSRFVSYAARLD